MQRRKQSSYYTALIWFLADLILALAVALTIAGLFTPILSFFSQHPLQGVLTSIAGLLLLGTLWFTVNLFKKQKSKAKHLTEVQMFGLWGYGGAGKSRFNFPYEGMRNIVVFSPAESARRSNNLLSQQEIRRKLQIDLVKSWIEEDPVLKDEVKSIVGDRVDFRPLALQESAYARSIEERLIRLEKRLDGKEKQKKDWMNWASTFYNLIYIIVAIPVIVGLIISLIHLLGH